MKINCSKKQRGAVVPLVTIALPVLLLAAGLALDLGHTFVNKTRLQNALDAAALSAAITIDKDSTKNTAAATTAGIATFNLLKATSGNNELASLNGAALVFEYSKKLVPFTAGTTPPAFVRVTSTNMLTVRPALIRVLSRFKSDIPVPAIATAGPVGQNCNLVPLVICPTPGNPQIGCDATGCNGISFNEEVCLKGGTAAQMSGACQSASLPTGNFGFLMFNGMPGGNNVRQLLAGNVNICTNTASWENGNKVGPEVQGLTDRMNADPVQTLYKAPTYTPPYYSQYVQATQAINPIPNGKIPYNREMAVPVADNCNSPNPNIIASACFFMTILPTHQGNTNEIVGELTRVCPGPGAFSPISPTLFGPRKIVLFKSPGSGDS